MGFSEPVLIGWCSTPLIGELFCERKEGSNQGKQHQARGFLFSPKKGLKMLGRV